MNQVVLVKHFNYKTMLLHGNIDHQTPSICLGPVSAFTGLMHVFIKGYSSYTAIASMTLS